MISQHCRWFGLLLPLVIGCANPGPPRPPSLNLAETVTDLSAERVGNQVHLRWTTPSRTTDGLELKGQFHAELCRETNVAQLHPNCTKLTQLPAKPGLTQATDPLPESLTDGPGALIGYRVQILNPVGRSAGASNVAWAAAGAAPPPVENFRATASRGGATLEWVPQPTAVEQPPQSGWIEINRILLPTFSQGAKPAAPNTAKNPLSLSPNAPAEVRLRTPKDAPDPGGIVDRTARKSEIYKFQAQRVRAVTLAGHALELRSEPSRVVTLHIADTFPPQPPTGLTAVPGEGSAIDLSWQPVVDTDLAGYHVYRRAASETAFQRLTSKPVVGPAFTDTTAIRGQRYVYKVTAIDTTGNESQPSNEADETAR
jgi:hypothetical protein